MYRKLASFLSKQLKFGSLMTTAFLTSQLNVKKHHMLKMEAPIKVKKTTDLKLSLSKKTDIIIIVDVTELISAYQMQVETILDNLSIEYPGIEIYKVTKEELLKEIPNLGKNMNKDTFVIAKSKESTELKMFDYYSFFMKTETVANYFKEITKINKIDSKKFNKFTTVIGICEGNADSLNFLKKITNNDEFFSFETINFDECAKFDAKMSDLFILKKNSKVNSYNDQFLKVIDNQKFDFVLLENFFKEENVQKQEQILIETINSFSIFTPMSIASSLKNKYTFLFKANLNKISDSERKDVEKTFQEIALQLQKEHKSDINLIFKPTNNIKENLVIELIDNYSQNGALLYKTQNTHKTMAEILEKKFPALKEKTNSTFTYIFDTKTNEFNLENFKDFLENVKNGKIGCNFISEEAKPYKSSKKLVFDNFKNIFSDGKDHLVFFFSHHCEMCRKVSKIFEESSLKNIIKSENPDLEYNRVNTTKNSFYNHSPVLAYFKKGIEQPFILNSQFFNQAIFDGFLNSMKEVSFEAVFPNEMIECD